MAIAAPGAESGPLLPPAAPAGSRAAARRAPLPVNIPALVLVVGGVIVQLIALVDASWIDSPSGRLSFRGMHEWSQPGYAQAFFSWIAWLLLAVTLVFGVAACIRWRAAGIFRYLGAIIGVAGAVMTVAAVLLLAYQATDDAFKVARNYAPGVYLAVLGLLATALGTAAGTGRRG
jgi:hypothetical protein